MANQTVLALPGVDIFSIGPSWHVKKPEVHQIPQVPHSQQAEEAAFQLYTNKPLAIPASFIQASTCAWTFPVKATRHRTSVVLSHTCGTQTFATHVISSTSNTTSGLPIFPETSGSTVYYWTSPNLATPLTSSLTTFFHSVSPIHPDTLCSLTVSTVNTHQPQASVSSEKNLLPEWQLAQYNGNHLGWHELFGHFMGAIESAALTDDVNFTYFKILPPLQGENLHLCVCIFFGFCRDVENVLKNLERACRKQQATLSAFWVRLNSFSNCENAKKWPNSHFYRNHFVFIWCVSFVNIRARFVKCFISQRSCFEARSQLGVSVINAQSSTEPEHT